MLIDPLHDLVMPIPEAGCWIWMGTLASHGYGYAFPEGGGGKRVRAHRLSWEQHRGPIPDGLHVLHKCDVPSCVNPDHLFLGTPADNSADKVAKKRHTLGEKNPGRKLTEEQAVEIYLAKGTQREIAGRYGIHQTTVCDIKSRGAWSHVTGGLS